MPIKLFRKVQYINTSQALKGGIPIYSLSESVYSTMHSLPLPLDFLHWRKFQFNLNHFKRGVVFLICNKQLIIFFRSVYHATDLSAYEDAI